MRLFPGVDEKSSALTRRKGTDQGTEKKKNELLGWDPYSKTYGISDLFHGFYVVARDKFVVCIEKFDTGFLKGPLGKQQSLDTRQTFKNVSRGHRVRGKTHIREGCHKPVQSMPTLLAETD